MPNLTTSAAAKLLGVSRRRVNELIELGTLKAEKFGNAWQVDSASVEVYRNSPRRPGRKKAANGAANGTPPPPKAHPPQQDAE